MPRRTAHRAEPGQAYAVEWPEWHVECGHPGCPNSAMLAELGEAMTLKEAEKAAAKSRPDWKKVKGVWKCPDHARQPS